MKLATGFLTALLAVLAEAGAADENMTIRPEGHLGEFLLRQVSGLTGNRKAMGYPFDGCMWAGSISNVYFEEDLPYSRKIAAPRDEIWWPYEQAAYLLDGMMRLSRLVEAPELRSEFKRNLDWCIEHQAPDGDLFAAYSKSPCQWPMAVFFRAALAYFEETGDARVKEAFVRHYASKRNAPQGTDDRDVLNAEGMLKVAEWTGDRSYATAAEDWFRRHHYCERFANTDRVHSHGVTFCEMLKLPMLLHKATGKAEWRTLGIKAMRDVFRQNETPNGQVSCCEYLSGRDPWEGSETCDAADMMCALSHFLDDPEVGCEAADHMERIAYNALPGAMTKDFAAHQYISLPNQAVATPFSHGGHFFYGEPDWNRFRVCHFAQCCSGNINRAMPLFAENGWRKGARDQGTGARGMPVSMLLGPGRVTTGGFEISCETDYPFGDRLVYRFKVADAASASRQKRAFAFRIPSWVKAATVAKNGTPMNLAVRPGTLAKVMDAWQDGDALEVVFEQPVTFHSDRHWHWLQRGALTLAYPVKTRCVREKPGAKFSDLTYEDPEPFNYAFDLEEMANAKLETTFVKSPYPFETPNLVVKVPMREIREWQGLAEQRFTPPVPLYTHETGRSVTLDFVPYATTQTRITAFPDTVKRTPLPVVRVYAAPECYAYDPKRPLSGQRGEPEAWTDDEFCDKGVDVQRSPDLWADCEAQYLANKGKLAYLLFRFWSDREGPVTCALGASRCVQAFVGGKEVYANGPIVEGRMVAPFWFVLNAKKGYNFLKVKVATNGKEKVFGQDQFRREWGAKLEVFRVSAVRPSAAGLPTAAIRVDWEKDRGPIKPVNAVGQPPMNGGPSRFTMLHYLKEAGIPYSRLHDVGGWLGHGLWVDIPNLFPDFEADENDPKNYVFDVTDALMKALADNGVEPYFRLGVTIENFAGAGFAPRRTEPPKDFAKWARICEHVIRHYTEGWADGPRLKVTYWEIWNEPENHPEIRYNPMWRAPFADYMRLYGTVAPYLKSKFPHLKIGGYGHCGFYAGVGSDHVPAANSSPRMRYFIECSERFLAAARDNGWPLDFFSYHSYSVPTEALRQVRFADELLNRYGFTADRTERHFNEWLPYVAHDRLGTATQAAGIAAELIGLQNGPCNLACIYDARCGIGNYSPLFNPMTYEPHKAYYAFVAFNELRRRGRAASAVSDDRDIWVAAARDGESGALMVANDSDREVALALETEGRKALSHLLTDADRTNARLPGAPDRLPPHAFCVILFGTKEGK